MKKILRPVLWIVLAGFGLFSALFAYTFYVDWSQDREARRFCDMIPIGSNISATKAKAIERKVIWGASLPEYDFYFFHFFGFDKAVCIVTVDKAKRVLSKKVEVEFD